jgi:oxygen-dependent protoporphyrinogen oxidase
VGAGIGGLAAAHHLRLLSEKRALPLEVVVLEATERAGGVLGSENCEGALLERGPDTLVTHKPEGIALCRRLGLADRLIHLAPGHTDILHGGRLLPVPAGFALLAPTRRWPLLASPLLGWRGKLRALVAPLLAEAPLSAEDESVASFVRRHFGAELLTRIAEPIVGAIYMADVERLSLAATFPRLLAHERATAATKGPATHPAPPAPGVAGLAGGLGQLVAALVESLPPGSLRFNSRVERLERDGESFALRLGDGRTLAARAVLVATPGHVAAPLLRHLDPALAGPMSEIAYASCVTLNLAWPRRTVERPPRSHGFFVPRGGGSALVAAGFLDVKFPQRVPADQIVVRLFMGGALRPEVAGYADIELVEIATRTLAPLLGLREPPAWSRVFRHPHAMPQRAVGHPALAARLRARLRDHPGLELAGGPVGAYGLADSIAAGESAATRVFEWCEKRDRHGFRRMSSTSNTQ